MATQFCHSILSRSALLPSSSWRRKARRLQLAAFRQVEIDFALMGVSSISSNVDVPDSLPSLPCHIYLAPALVGGRREEGVRMGVSSADVGKGISSPDGGLSSPDVGGPATDVGWSSTDVGVPSADAGLGVSSSDVGMGVSSADVGMAVSSADVGMGVSPADVGLASTDVGVSSADVGVSSADVGMGVSSADVGGKRVRFDVPSMKEVSGPPGAPQRQKQQLQHNDFSIDVSKSLQEDDFGSKTVQNEDLGSKTGDGERLGDPCEGNPKPNNYIYPFTASSSSSAPSSKQSLESHLPVLPKRVRSPSWENEVHPFTASFVTRWMSESSESAKIAIIDSFSRSRKTQPDGPNNTCIIMFRDFADVQKWPGARREVVMAKREIIKATEQWFLFNGLFSMSLLEYTPTNALFRLIASLEGGS